MALFVLKPIADNVNLYWNVSPGSGPLYTYIDETVSDDTTTYVYSDNSEAAATFTMEQLGNVINISKVSIGIRHTRTARPYLVINSTLYYGTSNDPSTTWTTYMSDFTTNPATGMAWTRSDINSMSAGFDKNTSSKTSRVTQFWIEVTGDLAPSGAVFNIGGMIKPATKIQANIGGVIKPAVKIQANIGGTIKTVWP